MRVRLVLCLVGAAAGCGLAVPQITQAHRHRFRGRITATPSALAVGETTTLEGTGFPADEMIVLRECATKDFVPGRPPCNSPKMTVETDASGAFTATFQVAQCQGEKKAARPQKCYVGDYKAGTDNFELLGAAKLTVAARASSDHT